MGILKSIGKFLKKLLCNCKCKCSSLCEIDFNSVEKPNETKDHVVETIQTDYCPSCASNSPRVSPRNSPTEFHKPLSESPTPIYVSLM